MLLLVTDGVSARAILTTDADAGKVAISVYGGGRSFQCGGIRPAVARA